MTKLNEMLKDYIIQDGAQFYDTRSGEVIFDYGERIQDHDVAGARKARDAFFRAFPQHRLQ